MRLPSGSRRFLFITIALIDSLTAVLLALAGERTNALAFAGFLTLASGLLACSWLIFACPDLFAKRNLVSIWRQHHRGPRSGELKRRFVLAGAGRADWIFFALSISIGSPLVAVLIIMGGWPLAHALKLRRLAVRDGQSQRYKSLRGQPLAAMIVAAAGLSAATFASLTAEADLPTWRWLLGGIFAVAALYTAHWNVYGVRWAALVSPLPGWRPLQQEYRLAVLAAAGGSMVIGLATIAIGLTSGNGISLADLSFALPVGALIAAGVIIYRIGLATAERLDGLIALYFAPVITTIILLALGLASINNLGVFLTGLTLLVGGNIWNFRLERTARLPYDRTTKRRT